MSESIKLPHSICTVFMQWMLTGGHVSKIKKDSITLVKGENKDQKVAKVFFDGAVRDFYEMNDYCTERYKLFLSQWFKKGRSFIESLKHDALRTIRANTVDARRLQYLRIEI